MRRGKRFTQQEVARRTGLAVPFLSRLENARAQPSITTLERLAEGLGVTVGDLLETGPGRARTACPVSRTGRCIAELIYRPGRTTVWQAERYSAKQIELLRLCNYLVQFGGPSTLVALETVMRAMLKLPTTRRHQQWLRTLKTARALVGRPGSFSPA
ncbi:MAG: helix-turn-helix transcriptional regulator [Acidobacteria bacterium]|nr:helix-turn-helix transcriptional regulator [Acidobacteriota bacterium]